MTHNQTPNPASKLLRPSPGSLLSLASLALCSSLALAQAAPPPPPAAAPAQQPAPIERQSPSGPEMGPGGPRDMMRPGGPGGGMARGPMMQNQRTGHPGFRGNAMMGKGPGGPGNYHAGFHGGPGGGFHGGPGGGMDSSLHIGPSGMWWKDPTLVQTLGLTPDQTKKMDDIFQAARIQLIDLKANVEKQNALLEPMLSANPPDMTRTMAQIDKVAQARADLEKANARMLLGIRVLLTPDQWTRLHARGPSRAAPPAQ